MPHSHSFSSSSLFTRRWRSKTDESGVPPKAKEVPATSHELFLENEGLIAPANELRPRSKSSMTSSVAAKPTTRPLLFGDQRFELKKDPSLDTFQCDDTALKPPRTSFSGLSRANTLVTSSTGHTARSRKRSLLSFARPALPSPHHSIIEPSGKEYSHVRRGSSHEQSQRPSTNHRWVRGPLQAQEPLDTPDTSTHWAEADPPLRPSASTRWIRGFAHKSPKYPKRPSFSTLDHPPPAYSEILEPFSPYPDGHLPAPIPQFGEIPGFGYASARPSFDPSSGAAARAAAAAQNEIMENMRRLRLSETKMERDSESGIGIDGEDDATGLNVAVVRQDPVKALPRELVSQILSFLDAKSVMNAELVCRTWLAVAGSRHTWKQVFQGEYREPPNNTSTLNNNSDSSIEAPARIPDWKGKWRARKVLDKRWQDQHAAAIYLEGHTDSVYCVQFDKDKIVTGSRDRTVRIWSMHTYKCLKVLGIPSRTMHQLQTLPTDEDAFLPRPFSISIHDQHDTFTLLNDLPFHHTGSILCLQYDSTTMVTGSSDNALILWTLLPANSPSSLSSSHSRFLGPAINCNYRPTTRLLGHTAGVLDVCLDATRILSCSKDATILLWDRLSGTLIRRLTGHRGPVNAIQLRCDLAVSASGDGIAKLWNLASGLCVKEFPSRNRGMACVEFSLDGRTVLAGGNDHVIYQFDTSTGELVREMKGHSDLVRSLHLDPLGGRVVSGSYDTSVRAFDVNTGECVVAFTKWTASWILSAKADYRRIVATSQDSRVVVMDFGVGVRDVGCLEE